ncbi:MAG: pantoate--beta-alanine ligase [Pirellulaceae bacterium]
MPTQPRAFEDPAALAREIRQLQAAGKRIGFVPTMGALHAGHLSLAQASAAKCDVTVVSIFVNPTQFAPGEDFERYPRTWEADLQLLSSVEPVWVFAPAVETMYPPGSSTVVQAAEIARPWEGAQRPIHFDGVCTVVLKLFMAVPADEAFFGQKDFQQCRVIEQMTHDLLLPITITRCPIVREADGLAMSSRNRYLSAEERERALAISAGLAEAQRRIEAGERNALILSQVVRESLTTAGITEIDYVAVADPRNLESVETIAREVVILVAVRVGTTRLIDNLWLPNLK